MTLPVKFSTTGPSGWMQTADQALETAELISGVPFGRDHAYFTRTEPGIKAGIWRSTPYTEWYDSYPCDEFMVILEGEVTLESDDFTETYRKGDAFMLPKGFRGYWRRPEALLKYYVLIG